MNAHVPSPATITRARRAHVAAACPAEAIGLELERVYREISEREAGEGEYEGAGEVWNRNAAVQLADRARALGTQLEWVKAKSLRGVGVQFAELQRAIEQGRDPDVHTGESERRVDRLSALIAAALGDLACLDAFQLGRGHGAPDPSYFAEILFIHTGEVVAEGEIFPVQSTSTDGAAA